jgi:putative Mn2+ efflux pump MntP
MSFILVLVIAFSLSMDAFSLSLAYGTLGRKEKDIKMLSSIVGIFHFFMPLLGFILGSAILEVIPFKTNLLVFLVLLVIGLQMIFGKEKEEEAKWMNFLGMASFALAVSLDSFSVGLGLKAIYKYPLITAATFMIVSATCTYIGLKLGKKLNQCLGKISEKIGGIVLIILSLLFYFK